MPVSGSNNALIFSFEYCCLISDNKTNATTKFVMLVAIKPVSPISDIKAVLGEVTLVGMVIKVAV